MNLLIINYEFPPIGGGGGNANYYILKELAKNKDIKIDLVTSSERQKTYIDSFSHNITIHRLNVRKKRLHYWTEREILEFLYKSSKYVKNLLKRKSFDLCHSFFGFPSGYIAYQIKNKMPYILSLRGSDVPGFNKRFSVHNIFLTPLYKRIWKGAKVVTANSEALKHLAHKTMPSSAVEVIPNGIDTSQFKPHKKKKSFHVILIVSRLISRKCIDYLLRAMPSIISRFPNTKLIIAGEGNDEDNLKQLANELGLSESINFMGYVKHDDLPSLYGASDIFILPSLWEGMSNTLLEAIASGLPVVVTDTGGTAELVKDNGLTIPKEDSIAISDAILLLLENSEECNNMGRKSREIALGFSWEKVAERYFELYRESAKQG